MNWYKISKKNKLKKKRIKIRRNKLPSPYRIDAELGLVYDTPNGAMIATSEDEIVKESNNK